MTPLKILVVDDDEAMREVLRARLAGWGCEVDLAASGREGERRAVALRPDLVLTDVVMPDRSGLELLAGLTSGERPPPVVLLTAHGTVEMAVEAMKQGARDFLTKPLDYGRLKEILGEVRGEVAAAPTGAEGGGRLGEMVGASPAMQRLFALIREVAPTDAAVLISGESGTGKELVARTLHALGRRSAGPFVAVNAAAIPSELMESEIFGHERGAFTGAEGVRAGCFELAHGGTLFLDEVAEMPLALQPKLLRVLEDGRLRRVGGSRELSFDVRLLAATNQEPQEAVRRGRLRQDLFYRLNVFAIALPPLRERKGDLGALAEELIRRSNLRYGTRVKGLRAAARERLEGYAWPGNVRELRNAVERAVVRAKEGWIEPAHLPEFLTPGKAPPARIVLPAGATAAEAERELIRQTLEQTGQNKAEAARRLGLDVKTLRRKLRS
jgi:DNA-binding NtrC family response regulator